MAGDKQRRKGRQQEMRALAALRQQGMTTQQLADHLGLKRSAANIYIVRLRAEPRRVYVAGHEPRFGTGGSPAPIWRAGNLPDVEYVPLSIPTPKPSQAQRRDQVLALLGAQPMTARELAGKMFLSLEGAGKYVRMLRQEDPPRVRIKDWRHPREVDPTKETGGDWAPVYAIGAGPDKPKPKAKTSAERHAIAQRNPEYRKQRKEAARLRYARNKVIKTHVKGGAQNWMSALSFPKNEVETA